MKNGMERIKIFLLDVQDLLQALGIGSNKIPQPVGLRFGSQLQRGSEPQPCLQDWGCQRHFWDIMLSIFFKNLIHIAYKTLALVSYLCKKYSIFQVYERLSQVMSVMIQPKRTKWVKWFNLSSLSDLLIFHNFSIFAQNLKKTSFSSRLFFNFKL